MAEECSVLSNEQTFTNKLYETLESNPKSTIWKRDKYYNILNKIKTGEKENKVDYYFLICKNMIISFFMIKNEQSEYLIMKEGIIIFLQSFL
jgi:hypothetical protein